MPKTRYIAVMRWQRTKELISTNWARAWFALTPEERRFIGGILLIFVIGLVARHIYLRSEKPEPYSPAGLESTR
ncbi:MAG: hypothetical protein KJ726_02310 [Verrucomicrobia bacterium]|nr:hypothetical protein [Verrucomicrobiota bacterium]MBU1908861.1 hypothetical protein [Verrucomicrobiota bacterium]